jgi:hypothetical protein
MSSAGPDERQAGVLEPADAGVAQPDLHQHHAVDAAAGDQPLEGPVVVAAGGREQHVQIGLGGGLDDGGDEVQLHVGQADAGRGDDQAQGPGPPLAQGPGRGAGPVVEFFDDVLDALAGRLGHRALPAERVGDGAPRHAGPARDLPDVHRLPHPPESHRRRLWRQQIESIRLVLAPR